MAVRHYSEIERTLWASKNRQGVTILPATQPTLLAQNNGSKGDMLAALITPPANTTINQSVAIHTSENDAQVAWSMHHFAWGPLYVELAPGEKLFCRNMGLISPTLTVVVAYFTPKE
jgi:hypothetical protein